MKRIMRFSQIFLILTLLSSCKTLIETEPKILDSDIQDNKSILKEGWIIVEESTEEKVCTWKSYPANKKCDMEKDKGCKITKPDKVGEEKIYLLEKQT